jgi:type IV pilus assembly protein PilA
MKFKGMKQAGFSLVELMVVVGIIGILAAIAVPKLQQFTAKSKQSEARVNLKSIDTMQQSYYAENSTFGTFAQIGYSAPGTAKYTYSSLSNSASTYTSQASITKLCPGDGVDIWTVNEASAISNSTNGADGC